MAANSSTSLFHFVFGFHSRYRLDAMISRFDVLTYFVSDAETMIDGLPSTVAQSDSLADLLAFAIFDVSRKGGITDVEVRSITGKVNDRLKRKGHEDLIESS